MARLPSSPGTADAVVSPHPAIPAWVGDLVATIVIIAVAFAPFPEEDFRPSGWFQILLVIAPAAVLPFRRRAPISALTACLLLYGVASAWVGLLAPGAGLAVAIAMFNVANRSRRPRRATALIAGAAVVVVFLLSIPVALDNVFDPRVFQFVLAVAFAAAAGDGARSRRAYVAAITERAERAEQTRELEARRRVTEERLRLARDLHDAVAHQIAVISLNAGVASSALPGDPGEATVALRTIRVAARAVLSEIGNLLAMLRTDESDDDVSAPQYGLDQLPDLLAQFRATGLDVHTRVDGQPARVSGAVGLVAYRVIQEALTNAHKHGSENRVHLLLEIELDRLRVVVTNPADAPTTDMQVGTGMGLIGLRERVMSVKGTVTAGYAPGGWKVAAALPLTKETLP